MRLGPFVDVVLSVTPPWWLDAAVQVATTVLSVGVGVFVVMVQLRRQHQAALEQQRAQTKQQLNLQIQETISARLSKAGDSIGTLLITTMTLVINLRLRRDFLDSTGRQYMAGADYSTERLVKEHGNATRDLISVLHVLEDYEIAFPGFDPIRQGIGGKLSELSPKFGNFHSRVLPFLVVHVSPADSRTYGLPEGFYTPPPPTRHDIAEIERVASELQQVLYDLTGFVLDVRVAAQNHLLAEIFPGARALERRPQDPRVEVLRPIYAAQQPEEKALDRVQGERPAR